MCIPAPTWSPPLCRWGRRGWTRNLPRLPPSCFFLCALAVAANVAAVAVADVEANLRDTTDMATTSAGDVAAAGSDPLLLLLLKLVLLLLGLTSAAGTASMLEAQHVLTSRQLSFTH